MSESDKSCCPTGECKLLLKPKSTHRFINHLKLTILTTIDGVVKTLHLLRHCVFTVTAAALSTPHSSKFTFLAYEVFFLIHPIFRLL